MSKLNDLTGKQFSYWTVLYRALGIKDGKTNWWCECKCGTRKVVEGGNLKMGLSNSCGCRKIERSRVRMKTHGEANGYNGRGKSSVEYSTWCRMKRRCFSSSHRDYKDYGAKGVLVAPEWINNYPAFLAYIGRRPKGFSLDRINPHLGYCPGNVRWASPKTQAGNKRRTVLYTYKGKTGCLAAICEEFNLPYFRLRSRAHRGLSADEIFFEGTYSTHPKNKKYRQ